MKTFLDSNVLLAGWKGQETDALAAIQIMEDNRRQFFSSEMVKLELLPKAVFFKNHQEIKFYNEHFSKAKIEPLSPRLSLDAFNLATKYGLAAADALNIAAAIRQGVQEFITDERPGKPMFRVTEIKVVPLHAAASL
ncbi:MAG: PIN domain-containing protein [Limisphaerales bacterium]